MADPISAAQAELITGLGNWPHFADHLPNNWPAAYKGVLVVNRWPSDIIENLAAESIQSGGSIMSQPIISVAPAEMDQAWASFGQRVPVPGGFNYGFRIGIKFILSAWADEALGGEPMAVALAGEILNFVMVNSNSLPSFRRLRGAAADTAYEDKPQLWVSEVHIEGTTIMSYSP